MLFQAAGIATLAAFFILGDYDSKKAIKKANIL